MERLMLKKVCKVSSLVFFVAISGCAATDKMSSAWNNEALVTPPLWADELLLAGSKCDTLTVENVNSFLQTYMKSKVLNVNNESAGKDAMDTYTLASVLVNRSQLCLSEALALKNVTEDLLKEKAILLGGTSLGAKEIEKHREYSRQASTEIKTATAKIGTLAPEQQKSFILGTATYLTGTYTTLQIKSAIEDYVNETSKDISGGADGSMSDDIVGYWDTIVSKAGSTFGDGKLIYNITAGLPEHTENMYETGQYFIEYAQQENLDLPSDVTSMFNDQDW
jgi:hypothetical protein